MNQWNCGMVERWNSKNEISVIGEGALNALPTHKRTLEKFPRLMNFKNNSHAQINFTKHL